MCAICKVSQWAHPVRYTRLTQRRRCPAQRLINCIRLRLAGLQLWAHLHQAADGGEFLQSLARISPPKKPSYFLSPRVWSDCESVCVYSQDPPRLK